ncbi:MAG: PHB depolymerase esterase [Gammaproteobacteria bacterium]|nr:MAG: PHB depolymerase esterase [Gammaproteobacteria bacterium]
MTSSIKISVNINTVKIISVLILSFFIASCGNSNVRPESPKWKNISAGGFSKVFLYVPKNISPIGKGRSLMMVLHGCVQEAVDFKLANLDLVAEKYGMVIALPQAEFQSHLGCWDYRSSNRGRNDGDYENLINLAKNLTARKNLIIDPDQIYIAGLSSGASFAMTTACIAPDIFAGMGAFAGPSLGTHADGSAMRIDSDMNTAATNCKQYGHSYKKYFADQVASFAQGENDSIVNHDYLKINADAMSAVYKIASSPQKTKQIQPQITEYLYENGRVSRITIKRFGHEWPAGLNAGGGFISDIKFNYGMYLAEYFMINNKRVLKN